MILREIADGDVVSPGDDAAINGEFLFGVVDVSRGVADERFQQRGFAGTVAADERDFFSARHAGGELVESLSRRRRTSTTLLNSSGCGPDGCSI